MMAHMSGALDEVRRMEGRALRKLGEDGMGKRVECREEAAVGDGSTPKPNGHSAVVPADGHVAVGQGAELGELEQVEMLLDEHWRLLGVSEKLRAILSTYAGLA